MTLNKAQFQQLIDNYANHIIEGLDNDSMEIMLFDLLTAEYETYTEEQIVEEIKDIYGQEVVTELLEQVQSLYSFTFTLNCHDCSYTE